MQSNVSDPSLDFLKGASICLDELRKRGRTNAMTVDLPLNQFFALRDKTLHKFLGVTGEVSDSSRGAISVLIELILDLQDGMIFDDVATWQPESILSKAER